MKRFSLLAAVAATLLLPICAHADTKHVTWTNATQNTDGTPIPASGAGALVRTTVEYGACTGTPKVLGTKQGEIFVAAPANTGLDLPLVVVQEFCLAAFHSNTFATTFGACLGAPGSPTCPSGNSVRSNVAITQGGPPTPQAPSTLTVAAPVQLAYTIVTPEASAGQEGALVLLEVGTVRGGAACDTSQSVDGFGNRPIDQERLFRVNAADVEFLAGVAPVVTFARCSAG